MTLIAEEDMIRLQDAIQTHDFLHRILRRIELTLRVVFHAENLDWSHVRAAAEQILIADIVTRHGGNIDGVYLLLRKGETSGHTWEQALNDYATYAHNYFTTPLGVVIRRGLFGNRSKFVTPAAGPDSPLYVPPGGAANSTSPADAGTATAARKAR